MISVGIFMLLVYFVLSGTEKIHNELVFRVQLQAPSRSLIITWRHTLGPCCPNAYTI